MDLHDLHDAHFQDEPPPDSEARLWRELAPKLAAPSQAPVAATALKTSAVVSRSLPWLAVVGVGVFSAALGVLSLRHSAAPVAKQRPSALPAVVAPVIAPAPTTAPEAATGSTLAAETALIAAAQRALREDAPARAWRAVQQHASQFEHGELTQEREALAAVALCQLHSKAAREAKRTFLQHWPESSLAPRVRAACP